MSYLISLPLLAILLWSPGDISWRAIWLERWGLVVALVGLAAIWRIRFRSRLFPTFLSYLLLSILCSFYLHGFRPHSDPEVEALLSSTSEDQLLALFALIGFLFLKIDLRKGLWVTSLVMLVAIAISEHPSLQVNLLANPSMAATFVVLASGVRDFSLGAAILTHSWTAFLAWSVGTAWKCRKKVPVWIWISLGGLALPMAGYLALRIPDNGRIAVWREYLSWWSKLDLPARLFGAGAGTTRVWLPLLNLNDPSASHIYVWAHNDWLQFLIEYGSVGAVLGVLCALKLFRISKDEDRPQILAMAVAMCSNFPTHWALHALVAWGIISRNALGRRKDAL